MTLFTITLRIVHSADPQPVHGSLGDKNSTTTPPALPIIQTPALLCTIHKHHRHQAMGLGKQARNPPRSS